MNWKKLYRIYPEKRRTVRKRGDCKRAFGNHQGEPALKGFTISKAAHDRRSARRAFSFADLHSRFAIVLSPEAVI